MAPLHGVGTEGSRRLRGRRLLVVPALARTRAKSFAGGCVAAAGVLSIILLPAAVGVATSLLLLVVAAVLGRHVLADLIAGVILLLAQPYRPGELVRLSVGGRSGVDAEVIQVNLLRTRLCTADGVLVVRNSDMLRTAGA